MSNYNKICLDGKLKTNAEGLIYFTTQESHSVNWIDLGNYAGEDIVCFRINALKLDQTKIEDGIDHDPERFKGITVKTYSEDIPTDLFDWDNMMKYKSKNKVDKKVLKELKKLGVL
jgi:hypothetical protein